MKTGTIILATCILLGVGFLTGLGLWQMKRLAWKEALISRVESNMKKSPLNVSEIEQLIDRNEDIEYRPSTATGRFIYTGEAHFFATHKSKPGYFIFTPLLQANNKIIMVNRGFVTMLRKDRSFRKEGEIKGVVTIVGLARSAPSEKPNSFVPNNDLTKNIFYWKSLNQMLGLGVDKMNTPTNRFFLDANNAPVPGGSPIGGVTLIQFNNSHLQYALTWFGLAGALVLVGGTFLRSRMIEAKTNAV